MTLKDLRNKKQGTRNKEQETRIVSPYYIPESSIELRAFTHGLMPRTVPAMMQHFVDDWRELGVDAWNEVPNHWLPESEERVGWWALPAYLGDRFIAPLIGAPEGSCIMQPNVHWAVQSLLSCREIFARKRNILLSEGEFPSVRFNLYQWAGLLGFEILEVPLLAGRIDRARILEAVDEDTALVILSHVGFTTGEKLTDAFIKQLAEKIHNAGGLLALDGYHAIGARTESVANLGVDVYFGGLLKEASGSSGSAFVYIRPGLELTPRTSGWFGDDVPFAFNHRPIPHQEVRWRFLGGSVSIAPLYHAVEGARILLDIGLDAVRADSLEKTQYVIDCVYQMGLSLRSPRSPEKRSAMLILEIPHADRLTAYLKQHRIYTDSRQGRFLRMAPFVWNTHDELEKTMQILNQAVAKGTYLDISIPDDAGPVT